MARTRVDWLYTSDDGHTFRRKARTDYTTQLQDTAVKIGGAAASGALDPMPRSFKPRVAICKDAAGKKYRVVCYENDAPLYTTPGTTFNITVADASGTVIAVVSQEAEGERKHGFGYSA